MTVKIPPLVRAAKFIADGHNTVHVDNFTGAIVHDKKVERALAARGVVMWEDTERDDVSLDAPVAIKRSHGGRKINPILIDATTASMIVKIWDNINETNRATFHKLVDRFAVTGTVMRLWKLVK